MNTRFGMKIYSIFTLAVLAVFLHSCRSSNGSHKVAEELGGEMDSIKTAFVPDRRVQIFDFTIPPDGTRITGRSSNREAYEQVLQLTNKYPEINLDSFELIQPKDKALINVSVGNMRSNPSHSAELSTQVLMGQEVTVWDKNGTWYYIQSPDGYLSWIDAGALAFPEENGLKAYHQTDKVMYQNDFGFCYQKADRQGGVISDLVAGDILRKTGSQSDFINVKLPDGREGYVPDEEVRSLDDIAQSSVPAWPQIEKTAYQFMGRPYLWGGTSGKGVDCSGFTKMVYYLNGMQLPRDASQQALSGVDVPLDDDLSQLEPGDFLFFGKRGENGKKDRVTHVGIYIGDGKMINSAERVQVQSLRPGDPDYVEYRRNSLLSAKRMIVDDSVAQGVELLKNNPEYGF